MNYLAVYTPKNFIFDNVKIYLQSTKVNYKNGVAFYTKVVTVHFITRIK
jgi:hypothetical protein